MFRDAKPGRLSSLAYLARCHSCFQNQIVKDRRGPCRFSGNNLPYLFSTDATVCPTGTMPMDRGRQGSCFPPGSGCLTSLWPLAVASPPDKTCFFGGIAKYSDTRPTCQTRAKLI